MRFISTFILKYFLSFFRDTVGPGSKSVLIFLPDYDFDPTEVVVSWKCLTSYGINVFFSTENGNESMGDMIQMKKGGLVFGFLSASDDVKRYYKDMTKTNNFKHPIPWVEVEVENYNGIILPGGHTNGMKPYLESQVIREKVLEYWKLKRPIGAMSRGVLVLARTKKTKNNLSIIKKKNTTTFPKVLEDGAFYLTKFTHGNLFRTYEKSCEEEVCENLESKDQFQKGVISKIVKRDTLFDQSAGFIMVDGNYVSCRWAGDSHTFICKFMELLSQEKEKDDEPVISEIEDKQVNENNTNDDVL